METSKKKILIVLTKAPYPVTDGTRKRLWEDLIKGLYPEFDLDLLLIGPEKVEPEVERALLGFFSQVKVFHLSFLKFVINACKSIFSNRPLQVEAYASRAAQTWLKNNFDHYHSAYFHTIRPGIYLESLSADQRSRVLLDLNDAISLNYQDARRLATWPWRLVYGLEAERVARYESKLLSLVSRANVVSIFDEQHLLANCLAKNLKCPEFTRIFIGMEADQSVAPVPLSGRQDLLFFGNLKYPPNHDALTYLVQRLWPKIRQQHPSLRLLIAGQGSEHLSVTADNIVGLGFVDDLSVLFSRVRLLLAPIRFGAGVPTKMLESLSRGVPVITTPVGARGLAPDSQSGIVCLGESDELAWVQTINSLLVDSSRYQQLADDGVAFIARHYQRETVRARYVNIFRQLSR